MEVPVDEHRAVQGHPVHLIVQRDEHAHLPRDLPRASEEPGGHRAAVDPFEDEGIGPDLDDARHTDPVRPRQLHQARFSLRVPADPQHGPIPEIRDL
jgi:hypothetical protein